MDLERMINVEVEDTTLHSASFTIAELAEYMEADPEELYNMIESGDNEKLRDWVSYNYSSWDSDAESSYNIVTLGFE